MYIVCVTFNTPEVLANTLFQGQGHSRRSSHMDKSGFIQASLSKIQGLFKDFFKTFLLFSRTENL